MLVVISAMLAITGWIWGDFSFFDPFPEDGHSIQYLMTIFVWIVGIAVTFPISRFCDKLEARKKKEDLS